MQCQADTEMSSPPITPLIDRATVFRQLLSSRSAAAAAAALLRRRETAQLVEDLHQRRQAA